MHETRDVEVEVADEVIPERMPGLSDHRWKPGQSGNPTGLNLKGAPRHRARLWAEAIELSKKYRISPLEYMLQVVNDPRHYPTVRLDAAKAAAPYVHQKMPIFVDAPGSPNLIPPLQLEALQHLSDQELEVLLPLVFKLASLSGPKPSTDA